MEPINHQIKVHPQSKECTDSQIAQYKKRLHLENARFFRIDHDDAMVAIVYKVTLADGTERILKTCPRDNDYLREVYFLEYFADTLQVPKIVQIVPPETDLHGAILMECLPGALLKTAELTDAMAYEIGTLLARIHLRRTAGFGDLIQPNDLSPDPRAHFTLKFKESFAECANHLPTALLEQSRHYFDTHVNLLSTVDGPCIIHRDFRPGNILVHKGKLQGIIDWSSGRASFAEDDFCPMEHGEWPTDPSSKKSFLTGYASVRPVPEYGSIMPLLRLSKAFATIGFTVKCGTWNENHAKVYQFNRQFLDTFF